MACDGLSWCVRGNRIPVRTPVFSTGLSLKKAARGPGDGSLPPRTPISAGAGMRKPSPRSHRSENRLAESWSGRQGTDRLDEPTGQRVAETEPGAPVNPRFEW